MAEKIRYWLPRVLGIAFALFISLFALDVFSEGYSFWETVVALFMHLIPTFVAVAVLVIAWKWGVIGGALYIGCGLFYLLWMKEQDWQVYLLISGPLFLTGILFIISALVRKKS